MHVVSVRPVGGQRYEALCTRETENRYEITDLLP